MKASWNRSDILQILVGLTPVWVCLALYNKLPEQMGTHIGLNNQVDSYMSRPAAVAMLALIGAGIPIVTKLSRRLDPRRENFEKFEKAYSLFRWVLAGFIALIGLALVAYNLDYGISIKWITSLLIGLLIMVLGNFMGQIRFNYTFGIRTPWTLADETVWRKTHRMAGPIWVLAGLVMVGSAFAPDSLSAGLSLGAIALAVLIPSVYSYWMHRSLKNR